MSLIRKTYTNRPKPSQSIFDAFSQIFDISSFNDYARQLSNFKDVALEPGRLLETNENGRNLLMYLCTIEIRTFGIQTTRQTLDGAEITCHNGIIYADNVTRYAQLTRQLHRLYAMRDPDGKSIIDIAVEHNSFDMLEYMTLFFGDKLEEYVFPFAASAAGQRENAYIISTLYKLKNNPNEKNQEICKPIIRMLNKRVQPLPFFSSDDVPAHNNFLTELFGTKDQYTPMEITAADCLAYLYDVTLMTSYMVEIEALFNCYYERKHARPYPRLVEGEYKFVFIDSYELPVPTDSFKGLKKEDKGSALQEFTMLFLHKVADWGNDFTAEQWIGLLPKEHAINRILTGNGAFFTEAFLDTFIFHGKLTHMFELVLICFLIRDKKLNVKLYDLIQYFLTTKAAENRFLWDNILDMEKILKVYLGDPYRLHSFMMRQGLQFMPSIATALIDTCCKRLNKYIRLTSQTIPAYNMEAFLDSLDNRLISIVSTVDKAEGQAATLQEHSPHVFSVLRDDKFKYSIVKKRYHPDRFFKFDGAFPNKPKDDKDKNKDEATLKKQRKLSAKKR